MVPWMSSRRSEAVPSASRPPHDPQLPLAGVRVLEFGQVAAAPFCGMLLADLGADVVKVERPPHGDPMRLWPPLTPSPTGGAPFSENFASVNRNKRSITCDFTDDDDLQRLRSLCRHADALVENFRPGVLARFGLDFKSLNADNPALVYCSITGYGHVGPSVHRGAFDVTIQAEAGLMSVTGEPGGPPVKAGVPISDFGTGLYAAFAIVAALRRSSTDGIGTFIDCPMLGTTLALAALQTSEYFGTGRDPAPLGSAHPRNAPYQGFTATDGDFVVAAGNQKLWRELCDIVGRPELIDDPRYLTQADRAANQEQLAESLQAIFSKRSTREWLSRLGERGIPCAPINAYSEILADEQIAAMQLVEPLELPNGARTQTVGFPLRFDGRRPALRRRPPTVGADSASVLDEWSVNQTATGSLHEDTNRRTEPSASS
jgi:succinate---hydroxymethylglutarate CoA-transferase